MSNDIRLLFSRYRQKGILIDTNILLLYLIGTVNLDRIAKFNRTEQFSPEDYNTLLEVMVSFSEIVTTPNVLTEVNSLSSKLGEPERSSCFQVLALSMTRFNENYVTSSVVSQRPEFTRFGLTDCGILELAQDRHLVLTDDLKLFVHLQSQGVLLHE